MDNEVLVDQIKIAIKSIRNVNKRPDKKAIYQYLVSNYATNIDELLLNNTINACVTDDVIVNKPSATGDSFFINDKEDVDSEESNETDMDTPEYYQNTRPTQSYEDHLLSINNEIIALNNSNIFIYLTIILNFILRRFVNQFTFSINKIIIYHN